jgi:hypothetical protein
MGLKIKNLLTEKIVYRYRKTVFNNPRLKWKDNIRIDLTETRYEGMDWFNLAQDRANGGLLCK